MSTDTRKKKLARLSGPSSDSETSDDEFEVLNQSWLDREERTPGTGTDSHVPCPFKTKNHDNVSCEEARAKVSKKIRKPDLVRNTPSGMAMHSDDYSISVLKERIHHYCRHPSSLMLQVKVQTPIVFSAAIQVLLDAQSKIKFRPSSNLLDDDANNNMDAQRQLHAYRKLFPPGTIGFTFPKDDKTKQPDPVYLQLEGITIYMVRWELNIPNIVLKCPSCKNGILIHQEYDFCEDATTTALWKASGDIDFACSMNYKCNACKEQCKANDGRLLTSLHFCNAYPVAPRYALSEEPIHLHLSLSRLMDIMLANQGRDDAKDCHNTVESFAEVLQQLQRKRHAELCEEYLEQREFAKEQNPGSDAFVDLVSFPQMDEWRGPFNVPTGNMLRTLIESVAETEWLDSILSWATKSAPNVLPPKSTTMAVEVTPMKTDYVKASDGDVFHVEKKLKTGFHSAAMVDGRKERDVCEQVSLSTAAGARESSEAEDERKQKVAPLGIAKAPKNLDSVSHTK